MLEITYGKRVMSLDDELVRVAERGIEGANSAGSPGSMLVDFFPIRESHSSLLYCFYSALKTSPDFYILRDSEVHTNLVSRSRLQVSCDSCS